MEWFRAHPYASAIACVGALVVAGTLIVRSHAPRDAAGNSITWSGGLPAAYTTGASPTDPSAIVNAVVQSQNPATLVLPSLSSAVQSDVDTAPAAQQDSFDYEALLAQMGGQPEMPSAQPEATSTTTLIAQAYQFVPQGFVATAQSTQKPMSAEQKTLYEYGNSVGSIIEAFETAHPNEAQVLKDQVADRTDPTKAAAVVSLGEALAQVGVQMATLSDIPQPVAAMHAALAQSYQNIGSKLQLIPQAQSDSDFVQAIKNYDATADVFVRNYATLASFLSASGVVFSTDDPGSVFSFQGQ